MKRATCALAFLLALPAMATTRNVKADCTGIPAPCYTTVASAVAAVTAGDTVKMYAGTYNENVTIPAGSDASHYNVLTVNGDDLVYLLSVTMSSYTNLVGGTSARPESTGLHIQNRARPRRRAASRFRPGRTSLTSRTRTCTPAAARVPTRTE
jgi:hypothetical protein